MAALGQSSHAPLASLAVHWHACRGEIPPPLVGASVTLVDDGSDAPSSSSAGSSSGRIYLFGGRLVTTRRMVNDMYVLDLCTLYWTRYAFAAEDLTEGPSSSSLPQPRYFHSCDLWNGQLIIFGGMGYNKYNDSELCVLNEVVAFDLATQQWNLDFSAGSKEGLSPSGISLPEPRYAHLSSITADSLVIIGGQDMGNRYVESINVYDLQRRRWTMAQTFNKQRGSYRSLAVGPTLIVDEHVPGPSLPSSRGGDSSLAGASQINLLPTSRKSYDESGQERRLPIYVYTNYNFTDVKREMEKIEIHDEEDDEEEHISIEDQFGPMNGFRLPPGLRFPMGAVLGNHLLISGTYLANTSQTFAIWSLYLPKMTWSRLDVGPLLASGSWNRGILWPKQEKLIVFGHRDRDLVSDYNHRQTNWDHVFLIELEAWGITQPPFETVSSATMQLGLQKLGSSVLGSLSHSLSHRAGEDEKALSLALGGRGDFEIVCSDGMRLGCDSAILEKRWPWFAAKMDEYRRLVRVEAGKMYKDERMTDDVKTLLQEEKKKRSNQSSVDIFPGKREPRITPRQLLIGEPSPVMLALLIFLYTQCICTSIQRHPAIVAALLIVAKVYNLKDLEMWAKQAAHMTLAIDLAPPPSSDNSSTPTSPCPVMSAALFHFPPLERHRLAVAVYEAATICRHEALQIRALRTVMSIARWVQHTTMLSNKSIQEEANTNSDGFHTPTTGALDATSSSLNDVSVRRYPSTTRVTSPASRQRLSRVSGESSDVEQEVAASASNVARRPSKAERMLGMSGADVAAPHSSRTVPLSQSNRAVSHSLLLSSATSPSPPPLTLRRPSAPVSSTFHPPSSALLNPRTAALSSTDYASEKSVTNKVKRFSIFGRSNESAKTPSPERPVGSNEVRRNSFEYGHQTKPMHRNITNGTTTSNTSMGSLQETLNETNSQGRLVSGTSSELDQKRMEKGGNKIATLNRQKACALKSIDTTYSPYDTTSNNGSHVSPNKSTHVHSPIHSAKLSDRELKALDSIWS